MKDVVLGQIVSLLVYVIQSFIAIFADAGTIPSSEPDRYDLLISNSGPPERSLYLTFSVHNYIQVGILLKFWGYMNLWSIL